MARAAATSPAAEATLSMRMRFIGSPFLMASGDAESDKGRACRGGCVALPLVAGPARAGSKVPRTAASTCVPGSSPAPSPRLTLVPNYHSFASQAPALADISCWLFPQVRVHGGDRSVLAGRLAADHRTGAPGAKRPEVPVVPRVR